MCEPVPGEPLTQIKKICFNRTKKTCCIRRGFEQLSSYSGWRVLTKKARANLLARAVVKGLNQTFWPSPNVLPPKIFGLVTLLPAGASWQTSERIVLLLVFIVYSSNNMATNLQMFTSITIIGA